MEKAKRKSAPDTYLSNLFMRRFGGPDRALPNMEAKDIRKAIDDGDYRTATELLIEYFGENSVQALNARIHELKDKLSATRSDIRRLTESNEAEHAERLKYMEHARRLFSLVDRLSLVLKAELKEPMALKNVRGLVEEAEDYMMRSKREVDP